MDGKVVHAFSGKVPGADPFGMSASFWGSYSVTFSPDQRTILSDEKSGASVYDLVSGSRREVSNPRSNPRLSFGSERATHFVGRSAVSKDGTLWCLGRWLGSILHIDTDKLSILRDMKGHIGDVSCLATSPDGRTIASGGEDGIVRLWAGSKG